MQVAVPGGTLGGSGTVLSGDAVCSSECSFEVWGIHVWNSFT